MPIGDLSFWQGAGSGVVAAATTLAAPMFHRRSGRLEREVEACKKRDAEFIVVKAGFRLLVGIVSREMPNSPELRICRDLLETRLPLTPADQEQECAVSGPLAIHSIPMRRLAGGNFSSWLRCCDPDAPRHCQ